MKSGLTAKLAKKIIANDKDTTEKIRKYGLGCLKCLESEPVAVASAIKDSVVELIFKPEFFESFYEDRKIFSVWKKILKSISKHFYRSRSKVLQIVLEKAFGQAEDVLAGKTNENNTLRLLVFALLTIKQVKKRQILIDLSDLLFNTFKSPKLFLSSCLILKTLYLKLSIEDFGEVYQRIFPTLFPLLLQTISTNENYSDLLASSKLIEFFRLINYDQFFPIERILVKTLQDRSIELNKNFFSLCPIELISLNSVFTEQDPENFFVLFLKPSRDSVLNSIEHLISIHFQLPLSNQDYSKQIKDSVILDLIFF